MKIKKVILVLLRLCISSDYRRLRRMKIFDSGYYLSLKGQTIEDDIDPLWTYVKTDHRSVNESVQKGAGWSQQADPHPLFDTSYYLLTYFPEGLLQNPLLHYLNFGWKSGFLPGPFFDPVLYGKGCGWSEGDGDPLSHFIHHGQQQGMSPALTFNYIFYFDKNPVLAGVKNEIIKHYKLHGAAIGKSPLPVFDPEFYSNQVGDEPEAIVDPLSHYLSCANDTDHLPGRLFEPTFYRQECRDSIVLGDTLVHYVTRGVFEGIYPHPRVAALSSTPVVSLLVPVYNPDPAVLRNCIRSVLYQAYPHWELCLVDDCSPHEDVRPLLEEWAKKDPRIKVSYHTENAGISRATNSCAALATGSYLGFLDNDDELTVDCLLEVVEVINYQGADLVYTDEDLIGDDGTTLSVFRKPCFNMSLLLSHNYITHFVAVKRSCFEKVGGLDSTYDGAQDLDLMLKLSEVCKTIVHIPKVLYHWRASESSTSINHDQKSYANEAGRLALQAAFERREICYEAADTELNFFYRLHTSSAKGSCTVFVWAVEVEEFAPEFLVSLACGYGGLVVDVVIISTEDLSEKFQDCITVSVAADWKVVVAKADESRAEVLQRLVRDSDGEYVCLLDGNIQKLSDNWLLELGLVAALPDVGIVCGRIRYSGGDGKSYLLPDLENSSATYLEAFLCQSTKHMAGLHCMQDMSFAGWDITLFRRDSYRIVGGFSKEDFLEIFTMAELSLRVTGAGKRIVYTPFAVADKKNENVENNNVESEDSQAEKRRFQTLIKTRGMDAIPYYNRGLLSDKGIDETFFLGWLYGEDFIR